VSIICWMTMDLLTFEAEISTCLYWIKKKCIRITALYNS